MTDDRRIRLGAAGEQLAAEHLSRRGLVIVERNFRTRWGELDIVAGTPEMLVFCEVKTRVATDTSRDPLESITPRKRAQVRKLAARWLLERSNRRWTNDLRFDAIGVTLTPEGELLRLDHLEGAF